MVVEVLVVVLEEVVVELVEDVVLEEELVVR